MHAARRGDSGLISVSLTEVLIRVGLITVLAVLCFKIFSPFLGLMLWALILAVILYPLHQKIARRMGNRQGPAATVLVLLGLLLIGTPTLMLGNSFAGHVHDLYSKFHSGSVSIKPPPTAVAEWPIVGKKVFGLWTEAADNLPAVLQTLKPQLEGFAKTALSAVASTASGIFQFLGSPIVAGIMMAYGRSGTDAMLKVASRLTSPKKGRALHSLSTLTIRSVAMGVVGVAFIQALLIGVGLVWADVPAAGLLSIVVLLTGIAQLPALIVTLPVIVYIWSTGDSTAMNVAYTIYLFIAGMADNFIKPLLLGRGVDIPMPVVLLGALGGMVTSGLIGLSLGAVLFSLGYRLFMDWVDHAEPHTAGQAGEPEKQPALAASE